MLQDKNIVLCKSCKITKSFPINKIPKIPDYGVVSNKSDNDILIQIYASRQKIATNAKFMILVDGSRYKIEVISVKNVSTHNREIVLKQYFLHYDAKRGQLMEVNVRFVKIIY